jgi:hypothetical protein
MDLIKTLKADNENLTKNYKEKLKSVLNETNRTISLLQEQLEDSKSEIDRLNSQINELNNRISLNKNVSTFNNLLYSKNEAQTPVNNPANNINFHDHFSPNASEFSKQNNFILGQIDPKNNFIVKFVLFIFC